MESNKTWLMAALCCAFGFANAHEITSEEECLAKNIYYEARNQEPEAQYAVAAVTLNRVLNGEFFNTICEVVYQRNQFSWYWDGLSDNPKEKEAWADSIYLARIMAKMYIKEADNTEGSLFYKKVGHPSRFFKRLTYVKTIGDHEFYK